MWTFVIKVMSLHFNELYNFVLLTVVSCSYYLSFVAKLLYIQAPPPPHTSPPWSSFLKVTSDADSQA